MCTIHTFSQSFWNQNRAAVLATLKADSRMNNDGITAIILAKNTKDDIFLSAMSLSTILPAIEEAMDLENESRIFVHQRMATTSYVGLPFNHGFSNFQGTFLMHNGIVSNPKNYCVDSFGLLSLPKDAEDALIKLMLEGENYVNMFRINAHEDKWQVLRLSTGSLYTDGLGNYSSSVCASISIPVEKHTTAEYDLAARATARKNTYTQKWSNWGYDRFGWDESFEETNAPRSARADERFILDDSEELLAESEDFFVTYCETTEKLYAYTQDSGSYYYRESAYRNEGTIVSMVELRQQARYILEECQREYSPMKRGG